MLNHLDEIHKAKKYGIKKAAQESEAAFNFFAWYY